MDESPREARHKLLNKAVTLAEATFFACLETSPTKATKFSEQELNAMAEALAKLVTLFFVTEREDGVKPLRSEELRGGDSPMVAA